MLIIFIFQARLRTLQKEAEALVGHTFSLNSSTQVRQVLYDELKLDKARHVRITGTSMKGVKSTSEQMVRLFLFSIFCNSII